MDWNTWLPVVVSSCFTIAIILYNRGKADNESKGRFKVNEQRISQVETSATQRIDRLDGDVRHLQQALMENSVLLATINERTVHLVNGLQRIEDKISNGRPNEAKQ